MTVQLHELSASDQQRNDLTVSVIICAYTMKRWDDLVDAVHSACSQLRQYDECLLVIDHNAELLERASLEFAGIQIMPNRSTAGLSGARNTGASIAQGDIVVFIDDDAVADSMMIENMRQAFDHPDVWGVGGSPLPAWPTGKRPGWFPAEFDWVVGCAYTGLPTERAEVRNMIGAAMAFRRQVFDSVGMFSVGIGRVGTIPVGAEETELCIRLRQARPDIRIVHVPQATVAHRVSADRVRWSYFLRRCYGEGISKGLVSRLVGSQQGLSSERAYVSSVLPKAFFRAIGAGLGGKVSRFGAAIAIVLGVAMAAVGYVRGRLSLAAKALQVSYESDSTTGRFQPVLVADIESSVGSMWLPPRRFDGERYGGAEVLIRSGADPLAIVRIPAEDLGKDIDLSPYLNDSPGTPLFFQHSDTLLKFRAFR